MRRAHGRLGRHGGEREPRGEREAVAVADRGDAMQVLEAGGEEDAPAAARLDETVASATWRRTDLEAALMAEREARRRAEGEAEGGERERERAKAAAAKT